MKKANKIVVEDLAKALCRELEAEHWGFIDPYLFEYIWSIPESEYEEELGDNPEVLENVKALRGVLERALASLQKDTK